MRRKARQRPQVLQRFWEISSESLWSQNTPKKKGLRMNLMTEYSYLHSRRSQWFQYQEFLSKKPGRITRVPKTLYISWRGISILFFDRRELHDRSFFPSLSAKNPILFLPHFSLSSQDFLIVPTSLLPAQRHSLNHQKGISHSYPSLQRNEIMPCSPPKETRPLPFFLLPTSAQTSILTLRFFSLEHRY